MDELTNLSRNQYFLIPYILVYKSRNFGQNFINSTNTRVTKTIAQNVP